jgi:hypothetical protein
MKRSLFLAVAALALLGTSAAQSGPQTAASPAVLTSIKAGAPTRMVYELDAKATVFFIPATGRATFTVDMKPDTYAIKSKVRTTGLADVFVNYDMELNASGTTSAAGLKTTKYVSQNNDGKKNRRVELNMTSKGFSMLAKPKFGNLGDPAATAEQAILANDPITALITFALEPRAKGADACGGPIKVFDGRQLTYLHLKRGKTDTVKIKTPGWSGQAIECHVTMDKIAGYKKGESNNDTLTGISGPLKMFLAPLENGAYVPVKIIADTDKVGKVTLQARALRFEPLLTAATGTSGKSGGK